MFKFRQFFQKHYKPSGCALVVVNGMCCNCMQPEHSMSCCLLLSVAVSFHCMFSSKMIILPVTNLKRT